MSSKFSFTVFFCLINLVVFSQQELLTSATIPARLKEQANAVIRQNNLHISLKSSKEMLVVHKRIITVLNKQGNNDVNAVLYYDDNIKIRELEALIYNASGTQIKKIRKNDFKDVSAVDGGTLYSDSRVKYLDYTPISYPYTVEFTTEVLNSNTAFIRPFRPLEDYFVSTEKSSYTIIHAPDLSIRTKEKHFNPYNLVKKETAHEIHFEVENLQALKPEMYGPSFFDICPKVLVASTQFALEGVESSVENWNDFGKWMYHDLIKDTDDLPQSTILKVQDLVKNDTTDLEKAKKIYQYVQDKTRYISVQVGIGGWQPFNASEVDRLGYGDCKALTNYTMSLLKAVGVKSNYVVVYSRDAQRDFEKDFASMQGDHVILNVPYDNENIWLECTSQTVPFGFIGDFTDDRDVLVISPEGGEIVHTKKYEVDESLQTIKGVCSISNEGDIEAKVRVVSKGIQYDNKYWLETETDRDLDTHYKKRWRYINGLNIDEMAINNDKDNIQFIEEVSFNASSYSKLIGERMLLPLNALNRSRHIPDRYRSRKLPLKIRRGFKDVDKVEIKLPSDYKIESQPENISIENKFGSYKMKLEVKDENTLIYNREFIRKDGDFPKEDYSDFRNFYKKVSNNDNAKIALIKK